MRKDMFKVIVERERGGSSDKSDTKIARGFFRGLKPDSSCIEDREDWEEEEKLNHLPRKITGRKPQGYNRKSLNENLSPLRRFIASRVGRVWNDVWSEICENINSDSTVQKHVLDHAKDYVYTNCYFDDAGNVWCNDSYSGPRLISPAYPSRYSMEHYEEPNTGILKQIKIVPYPKKKEEVIRINVGNNKQLHKLENIWYLVTLKSFPTQPLTSPNGFGQNIINNYGMLEDCVFKKNLYSLNKFPAELGNRYGWRENREFAGTDGYIDNKQWSAFALGKNGLVYAVSKKQLSKKELKEYNLKK
jgi:hypothetical protein